jgi:hypothetical protein
VFTTFFNRFLDRLSSVAREHQLVPRAEDHSDLHRDDLRVVDYENLLAIHAPPGRLELQRTFESTAYARDRNWSGVTEELL